MQALRWTGQGAQIDTSTPHGKLLDFGCFLSKKTSEVKKISMTGKGRSNDNAYVERLWRTLKYKGTYLHNYKTIKELLKNS